MPLYQSSVLKKHIQSLDQEKISKAYTRFVGHFHNATIQENIRNAKEEQYQGEFLIDLFEKILGYVKHPAPNFNLTTELKNVKDSKKVDGAVLKNDKALAVIELKGTNTTDLGKVESQAFGYKNNQPGCTYVITSNFEKLRFYIDNAVDFEEFNLFQLSQERFEVLWLCLSADTLLADLPKKIKEESLTQEERVTKKLYKDYSAFRTAVFHNISEANPQYDKLLLFKKTQKLLDRFLFIFFAEDRLLLPPNSIRKIIQHWEDLKDKYDEYVPLYDRFKKYFGYLNTGHKGKEHDIFAYNGGLFAPDDILDTIAIGDTLLHEHALKLSHYDFESEVSVNILGHIFEHSLTEIEEIQNEIEGIPHDGGKSKRKKEGVFYTPKYITKYIVDHTVGKLCEEKKAELDITDEAYQPAKQRSRQKLQKLQDYRDWLLQLTICDPACGSGAFLNQALEFLIEEHRYIDELSAKYNKDALILSDVENSILENNLYGVDINEDGIEIAKLSLWLHTAQKGRKLTSLSGNIKCGNSLIDDPKVAGYKAFDWQKEFPQVFKKGGFDVVLGNPPYLRLQGLRENFEMESLFYESTFQSATGRFDIYVLFMERSFELISDTGKVGFILPHKFMVSDFGEGIRSYLTKNNAIESVVHFGSEMVFADASAYTCIITLSKKNPKVLFIEIKPQGIYSPFEFNEMDSNLLTDQKWYLKSGVVSVVMNKIKKQKHTVKELFSAVRTGIDSGVDDIFILQGKVNGKYFNGYSQKAGKVVKIESLLVKPLLKGKDVKRYGEVKSDHWVIYPHHLKKGKTVPFEESELKEKFPFGYEYFLPYKEELIAKKKHKKTNPKYWYSLHRAREIPLFEGETILTPETSLGGNMTIDKNGFYHNTQVYLLKENSEFSIDKKYLLAVLNSNLLWFYLQNTGAVLRGGYFRFKTKYLEPFPVPLISEDKQGSFKEKVGEIMITTSRFQNGQHQFLTLLQSKFHIEKPSKKLQNWHQLLFTEFLKELKKAKVQLSLPEEAEWLTYFNEQKAKVGELLAQINQIDKEIDQMVYELYGLTEEEIAIVENS